MRRRRNESRLLSLIPALRLILEPAADLLERKDCSTNHDAYSTACHFFDRILNSTVAIRRQELKISGKMALPTTAIFRG
jgi:hypothetical protein